MDQSLRSLTGCAGIGLRPEHYVEFIESRPSVGFIGAHSEKLVGPGFFRHAATACISAHPSRCGDLRDLKIWQANQPAALAPVLARHLGLGLFTELST